MNIFYKVFVLSTVTTVIAACAIDPNANNMRAHTNQAEQPAMGTNVSEREQILSIVQNFATSVACSTSFDGDAIVKTTVDDVFLVGTANIEDQKFNSDYLVYWSGDLGCSGGMADHSSFMSAVNRISTTRPFLIETGFGSDNIRHDKFFSDLGIYPSFVSDVNYKNGVFSIISGHDNGDGINGWIGNNSPRYEYQYTVSGDALEGWKVLDKKLLGENKIQ